MYVWRTVSFPFNTELWAKCVEEKAGEYMISDIARNGMQFSVQVTLFHLHSYFEI